MFNKGIAAIFVFLFPMMFANGVRRRSAYFYRGGLGGHPAAATTAAPSSASSMTQSSEFARIMADVEGVQEDFNTLDLFSSFPFARRPARLNNTRKGGLLKPLRDQW